MDLRTLFKKQPLKNSGKTKNTALKAEIKTKIFCVINEMNSKPDIGQVLETNKTPYFQCCNVGIRERNAQNQVEVIETPKVSNKNS